MISQRTTIEPTSKEGVAEAAVGAFLLHTLGNLVEPALYAALHDVEQVSQSSIEDNRKCFQF